MPAEGSINQNYEFSMKSKPDLIDFSKTNLRNFEKILLSSSIAQFFSYAEVNFKDELGIIVDKAFFVEGLEFEIKYGNGEEGFLENSYCWSENQVLDPGMGGKLSGTNIFILADNAYMGDLPKSQAYKDKKISEIVEEVALDELGIDADKLYISDTDDKDTWYRFNEDAKNFISRLADIAYPKKANKSPILTFINTLGEFYFMTIEDFFSTQQSEQTYQLSLNENAAISKDVIQNFNILMGGLPINYNDYKKKIFWTKEDASVENEEFDIKDHVFKGNGEKLLIRKDYQDITDYLYLGLCEETVDTKLVKGQVNSLYKDSALSYRMEVAVNFNPLCVTGHLVELEVDSAFEDKQVSGEYSGKWLIIQDDFLIDENERPFQRLMLAKSTIKIDKDHPFKSDFLS